MHGETILCISTRIWDSLWRSTQQTMSRIAEQNRVLYFEPGRNPDRPYTSELVRNLPNFLTFRANRLHENLIVIPTPPCLPYGGRRLPRPALRVTVPAVAKLNAQILTRHVRLAIKAFGVKDPILWLYEPRHIDLIGKFREKLACYYNYDETADFLPNRCIRDILRQYDDRTSSRVDVVFATSQGQWQRRQKLNPNAYFIPNAVDFDLFNRALDTALETAPDISGIRRPIIGFVGWLAHQIDVDLLLRVAESCSNHSLVLVGLDALPPSESSRRLRAMPNVFFLGRKDLSSLPQYLKAIDVALIPYIVGGHTLTVYPLKLHEYLAAGRAIVATALPELQSYRQLVRIAQTPDAFVQQIREAVHDYAPPTIAARVALARENTWDHRVAEIYGILHHHLSVAEGGRREAGVHRLDPVRPAH